MTALDKKNSYYKIMSIYLILCLSLISFISLTAITNHYNYNSLEGLDYTIKSSDPLTPEGIRITAINDSSNSMVISWYTTDSASDPKVVYSIEPNLVDNTTIIPTSHNNDGTYIYSANLNNLESNKTYYYQVSSDSINEREICKFKTTPLRNSTSIKFMILGDSRTQREPRSELIQKVKDNFNDINFFIHTGDMVEDGRIQSQWNDYFTDVENLTSLIPGYYIEGNHEYTNGYMYDNLPLPSNGLNSYYFNFSIGPVSFIGLNTERDATVQTSWLEKVFKKNHRDDDTLWQIAYMHQPIFNSRSNRPDRDDLIASWCPLFEDYNLDLVFAGHNHYYERSYPMNRLKQYDDSYSYNFENPQNPMYLITGGAGAPLYFRDTNPSYAPFYNDTYHFLIIEIMVDDAKEETSLTLETWAMPNDYNNIYLIDNISIVKKGASVNIHSPTNNQLFGTTAPTFNVTIDKVKLKPTWFTVNTTWYTIDGGKTNFTYTGNFGTINQSAWDSQLDDTCTIKFYVNDSIGNIEYNSVIVHKDIIPPIISILNPLFNQLFGKVAPTFSLLINEPNLNLTWYTIDEGKTNFTFSGSSGDINEIAWEAIEDGIVKIIFYANDSLGNVNSSEILIRKDTIAPNISILNPLFNQLFGKVAPTFSLLLNATNLNLTWYTIDEGKTNFTFSGSSGDINEIAWEAIEDGIVKIIFYANDSLGNVNSSEILIRKDTIAPNITVIFPIINETFGVNPPNFTVIITDYHLDSMWYSFNESIVNITFNENLTINQEVWASLPNGKLTLIFFANDSAGNIAFEEVLIYKYIPDSNGKEFDRNFTEFIGAVISILIILTFAGTVYIYFRFTQKRKNLT